MSEGTVSGDVPARTSTSADIPAVRAALRDALDGAAIGSLTASVVHAGNNRLTVILSCLDLLEAAGTGDEDLRLAITLATGAAQQLAADFGRLLAGVTEQSSRAEACDLQQAVDVASRLDAFLHGAGLECDVEVPTGLEAKVERERLVSALLHVFLLARRHGARSLRIRGVSLDVAARSAAQPALSKGRHCRLTFVLVGARLPEALRRVTVEPGHVVERLDEPHGLQLAAVEAFVHGVRGHVTVGDDPDSDGTRIDWYLPASKNAT
ncbi:MAG TPA: hypothetical protein VF055_02180 [Steroidobacteraceae bacterium]